MNNIKKNTIVVFDTNAYRNIAESKDPLELMELIKKKEQELGVTAMMSTTVAMELIKHLTDDENEETRKKCSIAASVMYTHTGNEENFKLLPLPELQIAKMCFCVEDKEVLNTQNVIGRILYDIKKNPVEALSKHKEQLNSIFEFNDNGSDTYKDNFSSYFESVHKFIYSAQDTREREKRLMSFKSIYDSELFGIETVIALQMSVLKMLMEHGNTVNLTNEDCINATQILLEAYKIPLAFRRNIFKGRLDKNANLNKLKINNQFDEYILFLVDQKCDGKDILLVTDDAHMINAATSVNPDSKIMRLSEYLNFLKVEHN